MIVLSADGFKPSDKSHHNSEWDAVKEFLLKHGKAFIQFEGSGRKNVELLRMAAADAMRRRKIPITTNVGTLNNLKGVRLTMK